MKYKDNVDRIMQNIVLNANGCWIWQLAKNGNTKHRCYGLITVGSRKNGTRKTMMAHRFSYMVFKGKIPKGMYVLHKCDTPQCK